MEPVVTRPRLKILSRIEQMRTIGASLRLDPDGPLMALLRADPAAAASIGRLVGNHSLQMEAAYPGQTRTTTFTANEWLEVGHEHIAKAMRLMGLQKF